MLDLDALLDHHLGLGVLVDIDVDVEVLALFYQSLGIIKAQFADLVEFVLHLIVGYGPISVVGVDDI